MKENKLGIPFYLNIMLMGDTEKFPKWEPVIDKEYAGSIYKKEAVKMRNEYWELLNERYARWARWKFKTARIEKYLDR